LITRVVTAAGLALPVMALAGVLPARAANVTAAAAHSVSISMSRLLQDELSATDGVQRDDFGRGHRRHSP
jgi:hypothetical protein